MQVVGQAFDNKAAATAEPIVFKNETDGMDVEMEAEMRDPNSSRVRPSMKGKRE